MDSQSSSTTFVKHSYNKTFLESERIFRKYMPVWLRCARNHGVQTQHMEPPFGPSTFTVCHSLENLYYNLTCVGNFRGKSFVLDGDICIVQMDDEQKKALVMHGISEPRYVEFSQITGKVEDLRQFVSSLKEDQLGMSRRKVVLLPGDKESKQRL